jgi:hypothetical protein
MQQKGIRKQKERKKKEKGHLRTGEANEMKRVP